MIYPTDKNSFLRNSGSIKKIKPSLFKILNSLTNLYKNKIGNNLIGIYVRGSISAGLAKKGISDVDSVVLTKKEISRKDQIWFAKKSIEFEKKYPNFCGFDLTIISLKKLLSSKDCDQLRLNMAIKSVCLYGQNIENLLPKYKPGKELAYLLFSNIDKEIIKLSKIFTGETVDSSYNFRKRNTKFWCVWMSRVILRAGMGLIMIEKNIYSQDLQTCYKEFSKSSPQFKKQMKQSLSWSVQPISDKKKLIKYLNNFGKKIIDLFQKEG